MTFPLSAATPQPTFPAYTGDPDLVTPGVIGFIAILVVTVITILLVIDMTRRVRRVRYRGEIRERLEAEAAGGDSGGAAPATDPEPPTQR